MNLHKFSLTRVANSSRVNFSRWSTRSLVVLLVLSGLTLAVSGVAIVSYQIVRGLILENLKQQALLKVEQGVNEVDEWLSNRRSEVAMLANSPTVRSLSWSQIEPYFLSERDRIGEYLMLSVARPNGISSNTIKGEIGNDISDRDWFRAAMSGQSGIHDPIVSRTTNLLHITVSAPIPSDGSTPPIGAVSASIDLQRIEQVVRRLQQGKQSYAFALNSKGVPIIHPNPEFIGSAENPAPSLLVSADRPLQAIAQRMVNKQQGIQLAYIDRQWQYVAYLPLKQADWSIALVIPQRNIESQLYALNSLASVISGLLLVALVGAWRQVHLFEKMRTRAAQEALLNRLTTRIRESFDLQTIVQTTLSELGSLLQLQQVLFVWYDAPAHTFEIVCEFPQVSIGCGTQLQSDPPLSLETALEEERTIQLISATSHQTELTLSPGAYLALAIPTQAQRDGYLIGWPRNALSFDDWELLQAVSDQLAIAIRQADLYTQTQDQVRLLNATLSQLKQTQLHLVQSEKMSSLGQLIAGIAHEINNPVNFIHGNLLHAGDYIEEVLALIELYQKHYPQPPDSIQVKMEESDIEFISQDLPKLLNSMNVGAERIREIVQSLRVFSRLDEAEVKQVDIHEGIDSTLMILHSRLKAKPNSPEIQIIKHYGQLPLIECYAGQLNQVFMNILANAIDALDDFNASRAACELDLNPAQIEIVTEQVSNDQIRIRIRDNGSGMPEEVAHRIFDPFFTTKPVGKGTGMGLAISYQIITERHQGQLICSSTLGQGTTFDIYIPIYQSYPVTAISQLEYADRLAYSKVQSAGEERELGVGS
ncbi:MAG: ATP-binding protein [Desertifilum sp.]|nr:ATP-binding protein [Desertifilum sp.]